MNEVAVSGGHEDRLINTVDVETEARLLEALSGDETRSYRMGQQIEAEFIADWLRQRGW